MAKINVLLNEWQEKGLITSDQKQALEKYEAAKPRRSWAMYGVAAVGVIALAAGIISIIAANWALFSADAKLVVYFLSQAALGFGIWKQRDRDGLVREIFIALFALLILGGIGLIGQTYHLESDGYQAIYFWLIITLPVTLLARSRLVPHLWFLGLGAATVIWIAASDTRSSIPESRILEPYFRVMTGFAIAFFAVAVGLIRNSILSRYFQSAAFIWGIVVVVCIGATFGGTFINNVVYNPEKQLPIPGWPWVGAVAALACLHIFSLKTDRLGWKVSLASLLVLSCVLITIPMRISTPMGGQLFAFGSFVLVWGLAAASSAFADRRRLFDLCTFIVGARFVVAYFEVFGSLAATGIGLIISGCVILGAVWVWATMRSKLLKLTVEGVK